MNGEFHFLAVYSAFSHWALLSADHVVGRIYWQFSQCLVHQVNARWRWERAKPDPAKKMKKPTEPEEPQLVVTIFPSPISEKRNEVLVIMISKTEAGWAYSRGISLKRKTQNLSLGTKKNLITRSPWSVSFSLWLVNTNLALLLSLTQSRIKPVCVIWSFLRHRERCCKGTIHLPPHQFVTIFFHQRSKGGTRLTVGEIFTCIDLMNT